MNSTRRRSIGCYWRDAAWYFAPIGDSTPFCTHTAGPMAVTHSSTITKPSAATASQCIYAGTGVMNETPLYGWYYINANNKSPSWTGVEYLYDFLTRPRASLGPVAHATTDLRDAQLGDVIQLRFNGSTFQHSQSSVDGSTDKILVAAHSADADWRPLSSYEYQELRILHILGFYDE